MNWLRSLAQKTEERHNAQHIGIIGNCMIGPIPLALLNNPRVTAVAVAQPALPMRFWWYTDADRKSLGLSADDIKSAKQSTAKIDGLRFETDCVSNRKKQQTLHDECGDRFLDGEIPASDYQLHRKPINAHSALIGAWSEHGQAGQPSRNAHERVQDFS